MKQMMTSLNPGNNAQSIIPLLWIRGQSNARGKASLDRTINIGGYVANEAGINVYYKPNRTTTDDGSWQAINPPVNTLETESSPNTWNGLELNLGKKLKEYFNNDVYIVKSTLQGSQLATHASNEDWATTSVDELNDYANAHIQQAYNSLPALPGKTVVLFQVWAQGESDANSGTNTNNYSANFNALIDESDLIIKALNSSFENSQLFLQSLNFAQSANETTINSFFSSYAASKSYGTYIDLSGQKRKTDLTSGEKGGYGSGGGADDNHLSYLAMEYLATQIMNQIQTIY